MKIAEINMVDYGSTGNLMLTIAKEATLLGHSVRTFSMRWKNQTIIRDNHTYIGTYIENGIHQVLQRINGKGGKYSHFGTRSLINQLKAWKPDIVHLHNLHNSYINLALLFHFLKDNNIKTVWTLHDCWAFTGKCPHFVMCQCNKWRDGCKNCPALSDYPASKVDSSYEMWHLKKELYADFEQLTLVTPSRWLSELAKESFLCKRDIRVINNGIDLNIFKPRECAFRKDNALEDKKIILGVSFGWSEKKGLDIFIKLSKELPHDYRIILVGVDENIRKELPENIMAIPRTSGKEALAEIYSAADIFVNPTREENFPTVNMEALACGTPVVTFNTGGCGEIIDTKSGMTVNSYEAMKEAIMQVCENNFFASSDCVKRGQQFSKDLCIENYMKLYESILEEKE